MPPLTDVSAIRTLLETDRPWSVYPLGDLSPELFGHCAWFGALGDRPALILLYRAFTPPVLFALGDPAAVGPLLAEVGDVPELYLHIRPEIVPLLETSYRIVNGKAMWRMLLDPTRIRLAPAEDTTALGPADLDALRRLYADGEPAGEQPGFFSPSMLGAGVYFGVREGSELIAAAGTHLVVPGEGVAAIGNVYVRRDRRERGLGTRVTAAVAAELLRRKLRTVALNVGQDNATAVRVYERLGFVRYCPFVEGPAYLSLQAGGRG
jgi:ribosomal protein S18 acetylase RimI-like enzyme